MMLVSMIMVLCQCAVALSVVVRTFNPACKNSDQCYHLGTYCHFGAGRCRYCGAGGPLSTQIERRVYNLTKVEEECSDPMDGFDEYAAVSATTVRSWCGACVHSDGSVDPLSAEILVIANVGAMRPLVRRYAANRA